MNCTRAINELLGGIKWVNFRPMQKNMAEWRTPQMVDGIGGITQGMVAAFNEYLGGFLVLFLVFTYDRPEA